MWARGRKERTTSSFATLCGPRTASDAMDAVAPFACVRTAPFQVILVTYPLVTFNSKEEDEEKRKGKKKTGRGFTFGLPVVPEVKLIAKMSEGLGTLYGTGFAFPKLSTKNLMLILRGTRRREQRTENREQRTENREQRTENREQRAESREERE